MDGILYNLNKKANSTKQPTTGTGNTIDVFLKDSTSILNPVLLINGPVSITRNNYIYLPTLTRYYFILDWRSTSANHWECSCAVDVLGTYRASIGLQSHYVVRSASEYNPAVMDNMYISMSDVTVTKTGVTTSWQTSFATGFYVLGIVNDLAVAGSVTYYVLDQLEMAQFKAWMMNMSNYSTGGQWAADISEDTAKFLFNPYQYIVSIEWFPFLKSELTAQTTSATLTLGWWDTNITALRLNTFTFTKLVATSYLVRHPQAGARGEYLNWAPFSSYRLFLPPIGDIELNPERCAELIQQCFRELAPLQYPPQFKVECTIDLITGLAFVRTVLGADGTTDLYLYTGEAKISIPITVASILSNSTAGQLIRERSVLDTGKALLSGAMGIASAATGNFSAAVDGLSTVLSVPNNIKQAAYDAAAATAPHVQTVGNQGGLSAYATTPYTLCTFLKQVDDDPAELGRPLYAVRYLNTLTGYIKCSDAVSNITGATLTENNMITQFLNGGFFYE